MKYWVNEDRPDKKATVHKDLCRQGVNLPKKAEDGCWHGPFHTKEKAQESAIATGFRQHCCRYKECFG